MKTTAHTLSVEVFNPANHHTVLNPLIPKGTSCPHSVSIPVGTIANASGCLSYKLFKGEGEPFLADQIAELRVQVPITAGPCDRIIVLTLDSAGAISFKGTNLECRLDEESLLAKQPDYLVQSRLDFEALSDLPPRESVTTSQRRSNRLLGSITIRKGHEAGRVELIVGDLTSFEAEADVLVVSACPNDYTPVHGSVIAALEEKDVSVASLARQKEIDLRQVFSCWLSSPLSNFNSRVNFTRLLCYEPQNRGAPSEAIGDIFRCLSPFVGSDPFVKKIAVPLVAAGHQRESQHHVLRLLVEAAVKWIAAGMPISCVAIYVHPDAPVEELSKQFRQLKNSLLGELPKCSQEREYDLFISYAHDDSAEVKLLESELRKLVPRQRLFIDRQALSIGSAWQQEIYEAIDKSRRIIPVFSPAYLASKVCLEEFNIALFRHRESSSNVLFPVWLYSTDLPTYMRLFQHFDCREFNEDKMKMACSELVTQRCID